MALTDYEKNVLDTTLRNHLSELAEMCAERIFISTRDIYELLRNWNAKIAGRMSGSSRSISIQASLCRITQSDEYYRMQINYGESRSDINIAQSIDWINFCDVAIGRIERNGSIITLTRRYTDIPFGMIDFKNKTVSAITPDGKIIVCPSLRISNINFENVFDREWIFSYYNEFVNDNHICNPISLYKLGCDVISEEYSSECPKGYVEFCRSNSTNPFWTSSLGRFKTITELGNFWGKMLVNRCGVCSASQQAHAVACLKKMPLNKIENRVKREFFTEGHFDSVDDLKNLIWKIVQYSDLIDKFQYDDNRSIRQNVDAFAEIVNAEKNNLLTSKLQRLNFLNGLALKEGYTIVVPQNITDLQDEGRQQHNCVGSHYNDSIRQDRNLIYFIRKTEDVSKSYITCRYSLLDNNTVEYRKFANNLVTAPEDIECVKKISEIIKNCLDTNANK